MNELWGIIEIVRK